MYVNSRDMKIMLEKYKDRDFAVIAEAYSLDGIRHYKLEFCDKQTDWEEEVISIHFFYSSAKDIVIVKNDEWRDFWKEIPDE